MWVCIKRRPYGLVLTVVRHDHFTTVKQREFIEFAHIITSGETLTRTEIEPHTQHDSIYIKLLQYVVPSDTRFLFLRSLQRSHFAR